MSTRANIIVKDGKDKLFFYKHSDGYPDGTMPQLELFMKWLKEGKIRDNLSQASGWLIIIGAIEYYTIPKFEATSKELWPGYVSHDVDLDSIESPKDWKCGSIEPTTGMHGDIEYLYTIDLVKRTLTYNEA